ncbi:MAG: hypothetical protein RL268_1895 [Pseudomonadota bacterium]|jgi:hypothetical protein
MQNDYEKFVGPDGMVRIGHSLSRRTPEAAAAPKPKQKLPKGKPQQQPQVTPKAVQPNAERTFGARLRSILELPQARNRPRQALAIALETSSSPKEASVLLAVLPEDKARGFPHGGTMFPNSAIKHDAAAQRILAILKHPQAEGREQQALELALETSLPLEQVLALLGGMPKASARPPIPTIAERAALEVEIGESFEEPKPAKRGDAAWANAIAKANAGVGGASSAPPVTPAPPAPYAEPAIIERMKT